jgi:type IV pilus assembly protein PilM
MAKGVWGIDVSKFSVKAVKLEGTAEGMTLSRVAVIPYPGTDSGEPQNLDEQIRSALRDLKDGQKIGSDPVVFSLPSHSTFNRLIKLPPVDDAKIPEVVRYEAQSQIPFNIDEVIWDYQFIDRKYGPGEEKEVILFAIKRDIVEQFLANIAELGFNVDGVQFGPVALFNFLLKDQDPGAACVALDMGGDNTDLIVIDGTKFWVRNLPITGNDITKALQKAFNIPFPEAEKLKLKAGQSQQAQKIFNAIQPILRDLVNEINRSIGYYKSISKTSKFDKIVLLGNATNTLNFQKFVSQSLQLPANRVQKLNRIPVGGAVDAEELPAQLNSIGAAIGLALQGLGGGVNRVNLLPPIYVKAKELKKKQPYWMGFAAAVAAIVGLNYVSADNEVKSLNNTYNRGVKVKQDRDDLKKRLEEAKVVDHVKKSVDTVAGIATERDLILKVMDEVNPNIPNNGDLALAPDQRLWIVDWKFEEEERGAVARTGAGGMSMTQSRPLPVHRMLRTSIEVVITKRPSDEQATTFILTTLLNFNRVSKTPVNAAKPCVIKNKNWSLEEGQGPLGYWSLDRDEENLERPLPKGIQPKIKPEEEAPKNFVRYRVTLMIPVGEEDRTAPAAPPAAATEKK